jgi:hypothetical protein
VTERSSIEKVSLASSAVALVVALVTALVGATQLCLLAVFVGLAALWPAVRAK